MPIVDVFNQWASTIPFAGQPVSWAGSDSERINSYLVYENIYWSVADTFKVVQRGSDTKPIYIPAGRQIVETMQRYLAVNLSIACDPALGTPAERTAAMAVLNPFLRRERVYSKFSMNKRYGLIRGDWAFHIVADLTKPEGSRISFEIVDPAEYFPVYADDGITIIGVHLVYRITDDKDNESMYRQTYRKVSETGGPSPITVEEARFEVDAWGGPDMDEKRIQVIRPPELLPPEITAIPVYMIPNSEEPGSIYGSSEMRGIERLLTAINQSISDEELELALVGLGVYVTTAGAPEDEETGEPIPWDLGPAKVIELPDGKTFTRVQGTTTVTPQQEHLGYLHGQLDATLGMSDVTRGTVDSTIAESGIALAIRLAPIFARADEKELIVTDRLVQMLYDLRAFFLAYEDIDVGDAVWIPTYGERLPANKAAKVVEILAIAAATPQMVSMAWARSELAKLGYEFPSDSVMLKQILDEMTAIAQVTADVAGARMDQEIELANAQAQNAPPQTDPKTGKPVVDNAGA